MKGKIDWRAFFIASLVMCACTLLMTLVAYLVDSWDWLRQATYMPDHAFSEAVRDGYLRQPWNTFSSIPFIALGAYILCLPLGRKKTPSLNISENKVTRVIFALSFIVTGVGSTFLHMSLTFLGQVADVGGMYLLGAFIILYALMRHRTNKLGRFLAIYIAMCAALVAFLVLLPDLRLYLFAVLITIGLLIEFADNKRVKRCNPDTLLASASWLLLGFSVWIVDNTQLFFEPTSALQGHAVWHIMSAVSLLALFLYYERERPKPVLNKNHK
jgi:dihydroceramidase